MTWIKNWLWVWHGWIITDIFVGCNCSFKLWSGNIIQIGRCVITRYHGSSIFNNELPGWCQLILFTEGQTRTWSKPPVVRVPDTGVWFWMIINCDNIWQRVYSGRLSLYVNFIIMFRNCEISPAQGSCLKGLTSRESLGISTHCNLGRLFCSLIRPRKIAKFYVTGCLLEEFTGETDPIKKSKQCGKYHSVIISLSSEVYRPNLIVGFQIHFSLFGVAGKYIIPLVPHNSHLPLAVFHLPAVVIELSADKGHLWLTRSLWTLDIASDVERVMEIMQSSYSFIVTARSTFLYMMESRNVFLW